MNDPARILKRARGGERRWLARAITLLETRNAGMQAALAAERPRRQEGPGAPVVIGMTGSPGAGKSTLVDQLVVQAREQGQQVAVLAVDPSSPFSGGAILGDRVRMARHTADPGVYIRSMSSRGHMGGLSVAASEAVDLLDCCGFDVVVVETVGVGQSELAVMEVADSVLVVLTPESGDAVQAMKAGLLEVADVFVVNKADRPGAERLVQELQLLVSLVEEGWRPPVEAVSAREGLGVPKLLEAIEAHGRWYQNEGRSEWERRRGDARVRLYLDLLADAARERGRGELAAGLEEDLRAGRITPHQAVERA